MSRVPGFAMQICLWLTVGCAGGSAALAQEGAASRLSSPGVGGIRFQPVHDPEVEIGGTSRGVAWGDFTGDGYPDLVVSNTDEERLFLYRNVGGQRLERVTDHDLVSAGSAAADFDRDGDLDLFIANWGESETAGRKQDNQFFLNVSEARSWIQLRLEGTRSNRMGLGVRAVVFTGEGDATRTQHRTLTSTSGFGSMAEPILHFGLNGAMEVRRLEVHWPSGVVDVHEAVSANRRYLAVEGGVLRPDPAG